MEKNVYRFAGHAVEICSLYPQIQTMCSGYRTTDCPELSLSVSQRDIDDERRRSEEERRRPDDEIEGSDDKRRRPDKERTAWDGQGRRSHDAYLETLAVYRKLAESLIEYDTLLFHGSAVAVDGVCYLFAAKSGTGKSTHVRFWRELLGGRAVMVNDDKPLLAISDKGAIVWGTPWDGKHRLSSNISVPLRAICLLERGEKNSIEPISQKEAWPALWRQSYHPAEPDKLKRTLALVDGLSKHARLYRLNCTPDIQAARMAYEAMRKGESL